jgi:hydroxymethylpyrimidine/phosphomethylpyrimidine kinase
MNSLPSPIILCIGGFDPSGGAGISADTKCAEYLGCYALSVLTCNTIQSHQKFAKVIWRPNSEMNAQLKFLLQEYSVSAVKIGLLENLLALKSILQVLAEENKTSLPIVWDPIVKSSSGKTFHDTQDHHWENLPCSLTATTPNYQEALSWGWIPPQTQFGLSTEKPSASISQKSTLEDTVTNFKEHTTKNFFPLPASIQNIIITGVQASSSIQTGLQDVWIDSKGKSHSFPVTKLNFEKHGSGCTYSTALTCGLAKQLPLDQCISLAQNTTRHYLKSYSGLLGSLFTGEGTLA